MALNQYFNCRCIDWKLRTMLPRTCSVEMRITW